MVNTRCRSSPRAAKTGGNGTHGAPTVATVSDTGDLVLEFRIPDPASADAVYEVQASEDLGGGTWRTIATKQGEGDWGGGALVEVETASDGFQTVRVSGVGGARFRRLRGQVVVP